SQNVRLTTYPPNTAKSRAYLRPRFSRIESATGKSVMNGGASHLEVSTTNLIPIRVWPAGARLDKVELATFADENYRLSPIFKATEALHQASNCPGGILRVDAPLKLIRHSRAPKRRHRPKAIDGCFELRLGLGKVALLLLSAS